jgi:hypothetical protein
MRNPSQCELEMARIWHSAWRRALRCMDLKTAIRWQGRIISAMHREERARRALLPDGPRCWFCEEPGHDEAEQSCLYRRMAARRWQQLGARWRGKEGA